MKIKRTTGIVNPETGKKDFEIEREDGVCVLARRDGSKFVVFDMIPASLSQCKEIVADWDFDMDREDSSSPCTESPCVGRSQWDCVHPCALLIKLAATTFKHEEEIRRTLDAFGWMKPDGTPDFEQADSNFEKWSKK